MKDFEHNARFWGAVAVWVFYMAGFGAVTIRVYRLLDGTPWLSWWTAEAIVGVMFLAGIARLPEPN